ncbi:hypothetical protein J2T14_003742 [Paenibacillus harenae]|nr:hypothetical protein [Paenibacillus harenae]
MIDDSLKDKKKPAEMNLRRLFFASQATIQSCMEAMRFDANV